MEEVIQESIYYLINPELLTPAFYTVRFLFVSFSVLLFLAIIFLLYASGYLEIRFLKDYLEFTRAKPLHKVKVKADWGEITKNAQEGREADRKLAVIEADDAVNDALGQLGYKGNDLWEKLEGATGDILPNVEELKKAHKARRDLVYDPNRGLSSEEAKEMIEIYERTFRDLQIF